MKNLRINIVKFAVKGIKSLDNWTELEFYKKAITKEFNMRNYNIKGIYGINGAGKSGLISSLKIIRGLLIEDNYLSNPLVQKQLDSLINKRLNKLEIAVEYLVRSSKVNNLYHYTIALTKNQVGVYYISSESLGWRKAFSHSDDFESIYSVEIGRLTLQQMTDEYAEVLLDKAKNLLTFSPLPIISLRSVVPLLVEKNKSSLVMEGLIYLTCLGINLYVYLENDDVHMDYFLNGFLKRPEFGEKEVSQETLIGYMELLEGRRLYNLSAESMKIPKVFISDVEKEVAGLYEFLHVFKHDLRGILIEKREDKDNYRCRLILKYDEYAVDAEFESTGIKKLIRLYSYFNAMIQGGIVFIDELDANLHDVYLCALLEYLMEHAEGQLCFTTHNIGPMDILKKNKKSIDFLSVDHKVYSWVTNGNYSPSRLYRNGMIEGSPFNVDSIDFISAFQSGEGD